MEVNPTTSLADHSAVTIRWVDPPPEVGAHACPAALKRMILDALQQHRLLPIAGGLTDAFPLASEHCNTDGHIRFAFDDDHEGVAASQWDTPFMPHKKPLVVVTALHAAVAAPAACAAAEAHFRSQFPSAIARVILFAVPSAADDRRLANETFCSVAPATIEQDAADFMFDVAHQFIRYATSRVRYFTSPAIADLATPFEARVNWAAEPKKDVEAKVAVRAMKHRADLLLQLGAPNAAARELVEAPKIKDALWMGGVVETFAAVRHAELAEVVANYRATQAFFNAAIVGVDEPLDVARLQAVDRMMLDAKARFQQGQRVKDTLGVERADEGVLQTLELLHTLVASVVDKGQWSDAVPSTFEAAVHFLYAELHGLLDEAVVWYRKAKPQNPMVLELEVEAVLKQASLHADCRNPKGLHDALKELKRMGLPDDVWRDIHRRGAALWERCGCHRKALLYRVAEASGAGMDGRHSEALQRMAAVLRQWPEAGCAVDWRRGELTTTGVPIRANPRQTFVLTSLLDATLAQSRGGGAAELPAVCCQLATFLLAHHRPFLAAPARKRLLLVAQDVAPLLATQRPTITPLPLLAALAPRPQPAGDAPFLHTLRQFFVSGGATPMVVFRDRALQSAAVWSVGAVCAVAVRLYNPFGWPLRISAMHLRCGWHGDGGGGGGAAGQPPHAARDVSLFHSAVDIPPKEHVALELHATPLADGFLAIYGVQLHMLPIGAALHSMLVDLPAPVVVPVLPQLPQLQATFTSDDGDAAPTVFTGQRTFATLRVTNVGQIDIVKASVVAHFGHCTMGTCGGCSGQRSQAEASRVVCRVVDATSLAGYLPLRPGASAELQLELEPPVALEAPAATDVNIKVFYATAYDAPDIKKVTCDLGTDDTRTIFTPVPARVATLPLLITAMPGVEVGAVRPSANGRFVEVVLRNRSARYAVTIHECAECPADASSASSCSPLHDIVVRFNMAALALEMAAAVTLPWSVLGHDNIAGCVTASLAGVQRSTEQADALEDVVATVRSSENADERDNFAWASDTASAADAPFAAAATPFGLQLRLAAPLWRDAPVDAEIVVEFTTGGSLLAGRVRSRVALGGADGAVYEEEFEAVLFSTGSHDMTVTIVDAANGRSIAHHVRFTADYK
jgi:hypothetical protein